MACVGTYPCPTCGKPRYTAEGSTDPIFAPYAKPHVCKPPDAPTKEPA